MPAPAGMPAPYAVPAMIDSLIVDDQADARTMLDVLLAVVRTTCGP